MLIEKGYTQGEPVSVKIIGGEEIIARFESEDEQHLVISRPLAITFNAQGLGMIPWIFLGEDKGDVKIRQSSIVAICKPKKDAADQYIQGTTGIALA